MKKRLLLGATLGAYLWTQKTPQVQIILNNKVVVVTGASSGIGKAAALAFAAKGARVVLIARRENLLNEVAAEIKEKFCAETLVIPADISLEKDLSRIITEVEAKFGHIDILVNNAGMSRGGPIVEQNPADIRKIVATNLVGMIRLTQLVLPGMKQRNYGQIVNISSIGGILIPPGLAVYGMTKAGIDAFSQSIRRELQATNVGVTVVFPGWTRTQLIEHMNADKMRETLLVNPLLPLGEADYVAREIVDAVRLKKREVVMGGGLPQLAYALPWFASNVTDWVYRLFYDIDEIIRVMGNIGT
jgi:short-subunit dehydrogenase